MHQQGKWVAILVLAALVAGCGGQEAAPVAGTDPANGMDVAEPASAAGTQDTPAAPAPAPSASAVADAAGTTRACMIAASSS